MQNLLFGWVDRVAGYLENRPYEFLRVAAFCGFVAAARATGELLLGGLDVTSPFMQLASNFVFYLLTFHTLALILKISLPARPWRWSANAILIGLFLGVLPPIIDALVFGLGNRLHYDFMRDFPSYPVLFYDPAQHMSAGEATAVWLSIFFCGVYVYVRSHRVTTALFAVGLGYLGVLWFGSLGATVVRHWLLEPLNTVLKVPVSETLVLAWVQVVQIAVVYLALQPALAKGLARRIPHTLPFVGAVFLGAAFEGHMTWVTAWYAASVFGVFTVALAQNDFFDPLEEGMQRYVDRQDLALLNTLVLTAGAALFIRASATSFLLLLLFVTSVVYSYPFYRARDYFPANLKIEGLWGGASFLIGWLSVRETHDPAVLYTLVPDAPALSVLDLDTAVAAFLVFGGFSVTAALKDQKDIAIDTQSHTQTLYTLAARKGREVLVHRVLVAVSGVAFVAAPAMLVLAGKLNLPWIALGVGAGTGLALADRQPSRSGFYRALVIISAYLALLTYGLARQG